MKALVILALLIGTSAFAEPLLRYGGRFEIVASAHTSPMKGVLNAYDEAQKIVRIEVQSDQPVFGKTKFESSEQRGTFNQNAKEKQLVLAYKLKGAPHKWYFVFVSVAALDSRDYNGEIYKVALTLDQIDSVIKQGLVTVPADWKKVGTATLKEQ